MSTKISDLPPFVGTNSPIGDIPISINGTTYRATPQQLLVDLQNVGLINTTTGNDTDTELLVQGARLGADGNNIYFGNDAGNGNAFDDVILLGKSAQAIQDNQFALSPQIESLYTPALKDNQGNNPVAGSILKNKNGNGILTLEPDNAVPYTGATQDVYLNGKDLKYVTNLEVDNGMKVGQSYFYNSVWVMGSDDYDPTHQLQLRPEGGSGFTGQREQQFLDQSGFIPCSATKGFTGTQDILESVGVTKTMTFENGILISIT